MGVAGRSLLKRNARHLALALLAQNNADTGQPLYGGDQSHSIINLNHKPRKKQIIATSPSSSVSWVSVGTTYSASTASQLPPFTAEMMQAATPAKIQLSAQGRNGKILPVSVKPQAFAHCPC